MKVTRLAHVSVNVRGELAATREFYSGLFGLEDKRRPDIPGIAGHWHTIDDVELHLVDAAMAGTGIDPTGPHYCVFVSELDDAVAELDARGIDYVRGTQGEVVQIFITDPAGNTIELQQDPAAC